MDISILTALTFPSSPASHWYNAKPTLSRQLSQLEEETGVRLLLLPVDMEKFEFIRMPDSERWVVLMRADDPLAGQESVTAKELERLPLILPRRLNVQSEFANWFGD